MRFPLDFNPNVSWGSSTGDVNKDFKQETLKPSEKIAGIFKFSGQSTKSGNVEIKYSGNFKVPNPRFFKKMVDSARSFISSDYKVKLQNKATGKEIALLNRQKEATQDISLKNEYERKITILENKLMGGTGFTSEKKDMEQTLEKSALANLSDSISDRQDAPDVAAADEPMDLAIAEESDPVDGSLAPDQKLSEKLNKSAESSDAIPGETSVEDRLIQEKREPILKEIEQKHRELKLWLKQPDSFPHKWDKMESLTTEINHLQMEVSNLRTSQEQKADDAELKQEIERSEQVKARRDARGAQRKIKNREAERAFKAEEARQANADKDLSPTDRQKKTELIEQKKALIEQKDAEILQLLTQLNRLPPEGFARMDALTMESALLKRELRELKEG